MEQEQVTLFAQNRTLTGKKTRALRRQGITPVHVYGLEDPPLSLQAESGQVLAVLRTAGYTTPVNVRVQGEEETVTLIREIDRHPVTGDVRHVDFMRVDPKRRVEVRVPVILINQEDAEGARGGAGFVTQGTYEVTVLARPFDAPNEILADCTVLKTLESTITVADLSYPAGVEPAGDTAQNVAWVQPPRVSSEETDEAPQDPLIPESAQTSQPNPL